MVNKGIYYLTPDCEPTENMAVDEWLFHRIQYNSLPVATILRLYSWKIPAITIGYNQDENRAVNTALLDKNLPIIRRITGGRAIYHDPGEITFSISINTARLSNASDSLSAINQLISESVVAALNKVGIKAVWARASDHNFASTSRGRLKACFMSLSRHEIISGTSKIAAGAQRRIGPFLIHQGSIKINGISPCPAIGQTEEHSDRIHPGIVSADGRPHLHDFSPAFLKSFEEVMKISFEQASISTDERSDLDKFRKMVAINGLARR